MATRTTPNGKGLETPIVKTNKLSSMLVSELLGTVRVDQSAETIKEIAAKTGRGEMTAARLVKKLMAEGKLEKVLKQVGNRAVPAYRVK